MFSLCIPTMNRYDNFLSTYLPKYIDNELIDEIVITDETGEDVEKIRNKYGGCSKLKLHVNPTTYGPFLNKYKCCRLAKNKWIALIDPDNFADKEYFLCAKEFMKDRGLENATNAILAPSFARPKFDYRHLSGQVFRKGAMNQIKDHDANMRDHASQKPYSVFLNTGNYILNKHLVDNIDLSMEFGHLHRSSACDVLYFNTILFEQENLHMYVVPGLFYEHGAHDESIYLTTHNNTCDFVRVVSERFHVLT